MRALEVVGVGGILAGAAWWIYRERERERAAATAAAELVALAEARALAAADVAGRGVAAVAPVATGPVAPSSSIAAGAGVRAPPGTIAAPRPTVTAVVAGADADAGLSRQFDPLFRTLGQGIPVAYLRALAQAESGIRPDSRLGLINVVHVAVDDYNRRHPAAPVTAAAMRDPAVNVRVAADTLRAIIASYRRHHADVRNLVEDWRNPRFVELLTAGWNAGFSERGGVGRVVRYLRAGPVANPGADDLTVDHIFAAASAAGATRHLSNPHKLAFAKAVTRAYLREVARDAAGASPVA